MEFSGATGAEEFHGVAALDEREAFGQQPFQLDRANLRAVLFRLAAFLGVLIVVELALDTVRGTVEEIDRGPEEILKIGLEARAPSVATSASKMSATAPPRASAGGSGLGSGSSWNGRCP